MRIAPESRQSLDRLKWEAFQKAIGQWFNERHLDLGRISHLCIALTYVLSERRKDRDLDNMTKAIMDAFSRAVGFDDKDIHHLDVLKLRGPCPEELVFVRIAPSHIQDESTVMVPEYQGRFEVGDAISIDDFVPD